MPRFFIPDFHSTYPGAIVESTPHSRWPPHRSFPHSRVEIDLTGDTVDDPEHDRIISSENISAPYRYYPSSRLTIPSPVMPIYHQGRSSFSPYNVFHPIIPINNFSSGYPAPSFQSYPAYPSIQRPHQRNPNLKNLVPGQRLAFLDKHCATTSRSLSNTPSLKTCVQPDVTSSHQERSLIRWSFGQFVQTEWGPACLGKDCGDGEFEAFFPGYKSPYLVAESELSVLNTDSIDAKTYRKLHKFWMALKESLSKSPVLALKEVTSRKKSSTIVVPEKKRKRQRETSDQEDEEEDESAHSRWLRSHSRRKAAPQKIENIDARIGEGYQADIPDMIQSRHAPLKDESSMAARDDVPMTDDEIARALSLPLPPTKSLYAHTAELGPVLQSEAQPRWLCCGRKKRAAGCTCITRGINDLIGA